MTTVDLSSYSNENYAPGALWKRCLWLGVSRVFFETHFPWPSSFKSSVLRLFGANIGKGVVLKPQVKIKYPWFLAIGDHCWIGEQVWIDNLVLVEIRNHVVISQGAYLVTGNHDYTSSSFDLLVSPIEIESGSWLGAKSIVCPGVKLPENVVLSVGSVANKSLEETSAVYAGNPCQFVRKRELKT